MRAREKGIIDPTAFVDRARYELGGDDGYSSPSHFWASIERELSSIHKHYDEPYWQDQPRRVACWLEKDALAGVIREILEPYRVKLFVARGYSSFTKVFQAAQEFGEGVVVLQLTDFDPSGEDMVRDLSSRLRRYGSEAEVVKAALTREQVVRYNLPPLPAKRADPRYAWFADTRGDKATELDALPPETLRDILIEAIESRIDREAWERTRARVKRRREALRDTVERLSALAGELREDVEAIE